MMMKKFEFQKTVALLLMALVAGCSDTPTYEDMIKAERKAVNKLIAMEGIEVLERFPTNGVFGEKQFVKLEDDVYLNIVDSGNGNKAVTGKTTVLVRCSGKFIFESDTGTFSTFGNSYDPIEFLYGYASIAISNSPNNPYSETWYFLSEGVELALQYVGENAVVKMIVPFDKGSQYQNSYDSYARRPLYYDKIKFTFY
jgi:hypothetical protein